MVPRPFSSGCTFGLQRYGEVAFAVCFGIHWILCPLAWLTSRYTITHYYSIYMPSTGTWLHNVGRGSPSGSSSAKSWLVSRGTC